MNTDFQYSYSDRNGVSREGEVIRLVLSGAPQPGDVETVMASLEQGPLLFARADIGYFIPVQLGLPEIVRDPSTDDDHYWHLLTPAGIRETDEAPTFDRSFASLVEAFRTTTWNPRPL